MYVFRKALMLITLLVAGSVYAMAPSTSSYQGSGSTPTSSSQNQTIAPMSVCSTEEIKKPIIDDKKASMEERALAQQNNKKSQIRAEHSTVLCNRGMAVLQGDATNFDLLSAGECFAKAAETGDPRSLCTMACCLLDGNLGFAIDKAKAITLFAQAVARGNKEALVYLCHCYRYGLGVEQDDTMAAMYYTSAVTKRGEAWVEHYLDEFKTKKLGFGNSSCTSCLCRDTKCPVCFEQMCVGMSVQYCVNGHACHITCAKSWQEAQHCSPVCPYCRSTKVAEGKLVDKEEAVGDNLRYTTDASCIIC